MRLTRKCLGSGVEAQESTVLPVDKKMPATTSRDGRRHDFQAGPDAVQALDLL